MGNKPWEDHAGATVLGEKPEAAPAAPASTADAGPPVESAKVMPWEKYAGSKIVGIPAADTIHQAEMAQEAEATLNRVKYTAPDSGTLAGWTNRVARATTFGASDLVSSKILGHQLRKQDPSITDEEVLKAMREGFNEDVSLTAEIVGTLAPGAAVAKGVTAAGRVAMGAATKAGLAKGAINWLGKDKLFSRVASAAGGGAAMGATYEAIRVGVDEAIGQHAGEGMLDPEEIMDAGLQGAVVGAFMGPVAQEVLARPAGAFVNWFKQSFGGPEAAVLNGSKRMIQKLSNGKETPDQTLLRVRADIADFTERNGYPPALFQVVSGDKAAEIADVARFYNGVSPRGKVLTDKQVDASIDAFEATVRGGKPLKDTRVIENEIRDNFNALMRTHGDEMVDVGKPAMEALRRNRAFLETQAKGNEEARQLLKVVKANDDLSSLSAKAAKLSTSKNLADDAADISNMKRELADLIDEMKKEAEVDPSRIVQLQEMIALETAINNQMAKGVKAGWATANANNAKRQLQQAQQTLQDFANKGMKVSLRSINDMRVNASREANGQVDPNFKAMARAVREAIAPVGTKEVPRYGRMVKMWNTQMTRSEAHATGAQAAKGKISAENLISTIRSGRLPNKAEGSRTAVARGVEEGARINLRQSARGSQDEALGVAKKVGGSKAVQENLDIAIPGGGGRKIVSSARDATKTKKNADIVNSKKSPSELQEEANKVRDEVGGAMMNSMGAAGFAANVSRHLMKFKIPRNTAVKIMDMFTDPKQIDDALSYVQSRGVNVKELATVIALAAAQAEDKKKAATKKRRAQN